MMDAPEIERADEIITRALSGRVSAIEVERLRAQLAAFRAKLGEAERPSRRVGTLARRARWGLGITLAAGVAATAIVGLLLWPRTSFADVAAAVAKQPWIHVRQVLAGVTVGENWYSPSREIAAAMGCMEATARKHVARARKHLKEWLSHLAPDKTTRNQ